MEIRTTYTAKCKGEDYTFETVKEAESFYVKERQIEVIAL
tara:strand:+ start:325 stop:444 length:120 start_codon:yes stop_codon:yes gene_type:complete